MPDNRLILHIGHGKTGSSYIQSSLAMSQAALRQSGIEYPDHRSLDIAREGRISSGNVSLNEAWAEYLEQQWRKKPGNSLLFSNEGLFRALQGQRQNYEGFKHLTELGQVEVILFIRNPVEHCTSAYFQTVKRGGFTGEFEDFVPRYRVPIQVKRTMDLIRQTSAAIKIRNYSNHRRDILASFADCLELSDSAILKTPVHERINRSLTLSELYVQRKFNSEYGQDSSQFISDQLCERLPDIESGNPGFTEESYRVLCEQLETAANAVNERIDPSERYVFEEPEFRLDGSGDTSTQLTFTREQIDVLVHSICNRMPVRGTSKFADRLRNIAIKIKGNQLLTQASAEGPDDPGKAGRI